MQVIPYYSYRWQTADGSKPEDDAKDCGLLSAFATREDAILVQRHLRIKTKENRGYG